MTTCEYCDGDRVCTGCAGTGRHPRAGAGSPHDRDYVSVNQNCSWCEGSGVCSWCEPAEDAS